MKQIYLIDFFGFQLTVTVVQIIWDPFAVEYQNNIPSFISL